LSCPVVGDDALLLRFTEQYYKHLGNNRDKLHNFYNANSHFLHQQGNSVRQDPESLLSLWKEESPLTRSPRLRLMLSLSSLLPL
jgi:hypothetical protein